MAKVAILLPQASMCALAAPLVPEYRNISLTCLDYVETQFVVARALEVEKECDLIIARGVHARLIKYNTSLPVVEVQITTQELGMVMLELMRHRPTVVSDDFLKWLNDRSRFGWKIISGFFDPTINDTLKEAYLEYINRLAENVGAYDILNTTLSIEKVNP